MFECFAVVESSGKCSACIKVCNASLYKFYVCNLHATVFDTLEELALNLELKFPSSMLDMSISCRTVWWSNDACAYEIKGIEQEVLKECILSGRCLL